MLTSSCLEMGFDFMADPVVGRQRLGSQAGSRMISVWREHKAWIFLWPGQTEAVIHPRLEPYATSVVCACGISENQLHSSSSWIPLGDAGRKSFPPFYGVKNPDTPGKSSNLPTDRMRYPYLDPSGFPGKVHLHFRSSPSISTLVRSLSCPLGFLVAPKNS